MDWQQIWQVDRIHVWLIPLTGHHLRGLSCFGYLLIEVNNGLWHADASIFCKLFDDSINQASSAKLPIF